MNEVVDFYLMSTSGDHYVDESALAAGCGIDPGDVRTTSSDRIK